MVRATSEISAFRNQRLLPVKAAFGPKAGSSDELPCRRRTANFSAPGLKRQDNDLIAIESAESAPRRPRHSSAISRPDLAAMKFYPSALVADKRNRYRLTNCAALTRFLRSARVGDISDALPGRAFQGLFAQKAEIDWPPAFISVSPGNSMRTSALASSSHGPTGSLRRSRPSFQTLTTF